MSKLKSCIKEAYESLSQSIDSAIQFMDTGDYATAFGYIVTAEETLGRYRELTGGDGTDYSENLRLEKAEERFLKETGLE